MCGMPCAVRVMVAVYAGAAAAAPESAGTATDSRPGTRPKVRAAAMSGRLVGMCTQRPQRVRGYAGVSPVDEREGGQRVHQRLVVLLDLGLADREAVAALPDAGGHHETPWFPRPQVGDRELAGGRRLLGR